MVRFGWEQGDRGSSVVVLAVFFALRLFFVFRLLCVRASVGALCCVRGLERLWFKENS
jgi:hypothetical protein